MKLSPPSHLRHAFTLIELSIVLVIIGLIVGGILVGQDLIKGAKLRSTLSKLESYNVAATTFKLKYNALPGDIRNAATFGLGTEGGIGTSGNGDKQVALYRIWQSTNLNYLQSFEPYNFWYHLSQAGLVGENYTGAANTGTKAHNLAGYMPLLPYGSQPTYAIAGTAIEASTEAFFGNAYILGSFESTQAVPPTTQLFSKSMTALEAHSIDAKIDDGLPYTGSVQDIAASLGPAWESKNGTQACSRNPNWGFYDILGNRAANANEATPNPGAIDCIIMVRASW